MYFKKGMINSRGKSDYSFLGSWVVRGVAGVAKATPIFQLLLNKIVLKISTKNFLFTVGYPNLKFLTSSLVTLLKLL